MILHTPIAAALILGGAGLGPLIIYFGAILGFFLSIMRRPQVGLYFLIPLLPLQTTRYFSWTLTVLTKLRNGFASF